MFVSVGSIAFRSPLLTTFFKSSTSGASNTDGEQLLNQLNGLRNTVDSQQQLIQQLQNAQNNALNNDRNPFQGLKTTPIPVFFGKLSERTSIKVEISILNVKRVGTLTNADEPKLVELAACRLQEKAATWMTRLEAAGKKFETLLDLQTAVMKNFVSANEKTRATAR